MSVSKEELKHVLKKHEERETPEQEAAESEKEQRIEHEAGVEKEAFWSGFLKEAARPMLSHITGRMEPTLVLAWNPQQQTSRLFIERLDKALQTVSGLDRMRIIALDQLMDKEILKKLDMGTPGAALYRQGKQVDQLTGLPTEMELTRWLQENRGKLA